MSDFVVRRLLVDLETPFDRHWCGGDAFGAFLSAFFNALSMSFPVGEQFFIDSVRNGVKLLPPDRAQAMAPEVQRFIGQEATHRRLHSLFNTHLENQGLINAWGPRAQARMRLFEGEDARHPLGVTAANEHFTAIYAEWLLARPQLLDGCEARLKTLWMWHAAEEAEHKDTAFDVYHALGGNHRWRITWFRRITLVFLGDALRQTVSNLRRDGTLWKWRAWSRAGSVLFGRDGLVRQCFGPWREYLRRDFHPSQQDSDLAQRWLAANATQFVPVSSPR